jgi:hypothetical protein
MTDDSQPLTFDDRIAQMLAAERASSAEVRAMFDECASGLDADIVAAVLQARQPRRSRAAPMGAPTARASDDGPRLQPLPFDDDCPPSDELCREVVVFDPDAWSTSVTPGESAHYCLRRRQWGRLGARLVERPLPCDTWTCPTGRCALRRVAEQLRHVHQLIDDGTPEWYLSLRSTTAQAPQLRKALSRLPATEWYVQVRRSDATYTLMSAPIRGGLGCHLVAREPADAFEFIRSTMLALPGLVGRQPVTWRRGHTPPKRPPVGMVAYFVSIDPQRIAAAKARADDLANERHGTPFTRLQPSDQDAIALEVRDEFERSAQDGWS